MISQSEIKTNIDKTIKAVGGKAKLIAVSKTQSSELIQLAYNCGQRIFGENKVQELSQKYKILPKDIEWHFIGHLQTNKAKYIAPFVNCIHSVDSLNILTEIDIQAKKNNRVIDCLLEFFIAEEKTKFGLNIEGAEQIINSLQFKTLKNVKIIGVMGMASFVEDDKQIRKEFKLLKSIFNFFKEKYFSTDNNFKDISMGMSSDFQIAIEEGSTMIRIGTNLFGERNNNINNQ